MNLQTGAKIGAKFKFIVKKQDGSISKETDWFHNLVLDAGLLRMPIGPWIDRCCVGSGNSTPIASQASLDAFVASTTVSLNGQAGWDSTTNPTYLYERNTWRFAQGAAKGNLSEVGLGWGDNTLWNRALIKDTTGNPATITILADEVLDVVAEIRVYPAQTPSGSFQLKDKFGSVVSTHSYSSKISLGGGTWGGASQVGNSSLSVQGVRTATVNTALGKTIQTIGTLDLSAANTAHSQINAQYALMGGNADWGYLTTITPPIIKTPDMKMSYTVNFSVDRYTP